MYKFIRFFLIVLIPLFAVSCSDEFEDTDAYRTIIAAKSWAGDMVDIDPSNNTIRTTKVNLYFRTKDVCITGVQRLDTQDYDYNNTSYYIGEEIFRIDNGRLAGTYSIVSLTDTNMVLKAENASTRTITLHNRLV